VAALVYISFVCLVIPMLRSILHLVVIIQIPDHGWFCAVCGDGEFASADEAKRYSAEISLQMEAIDARQAAELRRIRKNLGLTQKKAAELFGGGVNAFSEYERGVTQPSKSTVVLLHLLDKHPDLLPELERYAVG